MNQERNASKEGREDMISLDEKCKLQDNLRTWDFGIMAVSALGGGFLVSNINVEPGIIKAVIWLGPSVVFGASFLMTNIRTERMANIKGQMTGIERQAGRTASLQDSERVNR
ncbi:hypothetical protein A3F00_04315 [Candidatus Daviesbacteria bacterium RIFCSPHIGHO2_12_FULL_37_11]|uniref:Uncharacterized protein n=1 Tax=Candidatus Daviesbacteria bacterium RIFCSPHIGHO2_12_FULL_37_11 TaxID=1797777 RepID=A0A1F5K9S2_9BACT|nr:MAG: hypothetical protein A2111_01900 [Candidatus Daviesbacteria bacterium GWA1_38_6]OGE16125.1 MAG: hypothetical protein A2769_03485 [Candidatus Daviesbacteria bacterium RIFCSPHIGHO2_01_FULL_37_27]OGE37649.1 MAG: hypothetical protein A3F00_04315 [Candidatus Daviesbacteria bacterium RIFCSPHIGHO2_12_FULL_37_11]OGE45406.1 MAG: hypothetical protein A3B39_04715 [Candidatus Daviesbacteria bacterium RIFCSPLOWO2_01_FULL_37_10]